LTEGWLRIEFVLADRDGDGIAERLMVHRVAHRILRVDECSHVPIATASPILRSHRWDGHSLAELVSDIQRLHTTVTRQMLDSLYQSTTPRKRVLTDSTGAPQANIDDLLDVRHGGIERVYQQGAVEDVQTQWIGAQAFPMLEYVDRVRMNRSGVNYLSSGVDANAINKTAQGAHIQDGRMQERTELVARVLAETLFKPIFLGILKTLTEHCMDKLAFKLRNKFVAYDPQEWRDQYDMTINVGLGTGNKQQQAMSLAQIEAAQMAAAQGGGMGLLVTPKHLYNLQVQKVKLAGFQNVDDFWKDPGDQMPQAPNKPDPEMVKAQAQMQLEQMKAQVKAQSDQVQREHELALERERMQMQTQVDTHRQEVEAQQQALKLQNTRELEQFKAQLAMQLEQYKADVQQQTALQLARINAEAKLQAAEIQAQTVLTPEQEEAADQAVEDGDEAKE
jgi:hypothetical protein